MIAESNKQSGLCQLRFNHDDACKAAEAWGANCGPSALAFAAGVHIDEVIGWIPGFDKKRYTSPTMMKAGIERAGLRIAKDSRKDEMPNMGLARIQWHGPWTQPGMNPRWAYNYTHWIARNSIYVFDINCGVVEFHKWHEETARMIMKLIGRCNGLYSVTHCWEVERA